MKKFLSLVLALVMTMSLVTVSAGAKDFTDDESIAYEEAVAVVSEVGIVDGYPDGSFKPTNTLTRQAAAKIICNLILGPTTASELHANVAPYPDVPTTSEFAGYIAYCQQRGIISGYADGNFRPGNTLTGYAFMKMLLGALGYDSTLEGYAGNANWSINVAKQALGIGLAKGLDVKDGAEFNGLKAVNREEACLYAFNTLQADLVEYNQRLTTNINGTEVTLSSGGAQSRPWKSQQTRINNIREDEIVQFAEEYFKKLEKKKDTDDFERPAYTWIYDKEEIGTYVDWELMVAEYTTGVSGRDLYDLLGTTVLRDNDLVYYVDGQVPSATHPATHVDASHDIEYTDIVRSNTSDVGITARGVLTQVFVDKEYGGVRADDKGLITIASIETWLGKADGDYKESTEFASIDVWTDTQPLTTKRYNVDVEDVANVVDVTDGDFYLVNITYKHDNDGTVVAIGEPETLEESTVTKFSASAGHTGTASVVTKLTTGGTEYKDSRRAYYDEDVLYKYDESLLTDNTYNVFLDQYGYFIGVELFEGVKNYVFITGFDRPKSNLTIQTAEAAGIFLDGTMETIKVNVSATNKNIEKVLPANGVFKSDGSNAGDYAEQYFQPWKTTLQTHAGDDGMYALNRWYTYSKNDAGVYTLKPATRMTITDYRATGMTDADGNAIIRTDNLYLNDNVLRKNPVAGRPATQGGTFLYGPLSTDWRTATTALLYDKTQNVPGTFTKDYNARVYGNDDSVFLTVDMDEVDTTDGKSWAITDVNGVYTGVQNVEIEIDTTAAIQEAQVYTVYDKNNYIIGAVTIGEGNGGNATLAYILGGAKSEKREDGVYYWDFDAVVEGKIQEITVKSSYHDVFDVLENEGNGWHKDLANGISPIGKTNGGGNYTGKDLNEYDGLVELRYDSAKEYVIKVRPVEEKDIYNYFGDRTANSTTTRYGGANSIVVDGKTGYSFDAYTNINLRSDAKAYRINGLGANLLGHKVTWQPGGAGVKHHYDSAPSELTLVGRTLYATRQGTAADQWSYLDEGLALNTDCPAVVIQKENGSWEKTEFTSVASAISHLADANVQKSGLQYNGEIVAAIDSRGAAEWVVFTNYTELTVGGQPVQPNQGISNLDVHYFRPNSAANDPANYTGFVLKGTQAGRTYDVTISMTLGNQPAGTRSMRVNGQNGKTIVGGQNAFLGNLQTGTQIVLTCGDMTATYTVVNGVAEDTTAAIFWAGW